MVVVKNNNTKSNFIKKHLIEEVFRVYNEKRKICDVPANSYLFFDTPIEPIPNSTDRINRFGRGNFYYKDKVLPIPWGDLNGKLLIRALNELKSNRVYFLKQVNNTQFCKTRVKRNLGKSI
jgi:hypothetical protein